MSKNAVIFYFSGTGNTWWVSEELARLLGERGMKVQPYSIEKLKPGEADRLIQDCDLAGFGYPIYGSDLPLIMKDFITELRKVDQKLAFVYCTQWLWSGDGARVGATFLGPKGFKVGWGEHILMPNNVTVNFLPFPYTNDRRKIDFVLVKASRRLARFANQIVADRYFRRGFNLASFLLGCFQRVPFRLTFNRFRDDVKVNSNLCVKCGSCARLCPSGNLVCKDGEIITTGQCILCLRCYNFCPAQAVAYRNQVHKKTRGIPYRGPVENFNPKIMVE
ncbi:MAG TPA: EFR1 family ferrodoxin [Candidatus Limnocylindrales bacterium]|nr:EFR1 family ferrodoxin [Candidatus Limnocylindrales bacterium]